MLFSSLTFLFVFLPLLIFIYHMAPKKCRNVILLGFSLILYAWGEPVYILLMIFSIVVNYIFALIMDKSIKYAKIILLISIIFNVAILGFYKYINFFIVNFNRLFNTDYDLLKLALPIGISFYTFQILSYIIDVYRKDAKVQKNIINFATYVSLFPQLIAGPIVRYTAIEEELKERKINFSRSMSGIRRFILGLGKKVLIANSMAVIADAIFNANIRDYSTPVLWMGLLAYSLQIYFDFSGYSDMAIGLGKIFGFGFPENFDYPYISISITEFWRRWHISLSSWFRDYIYIPLGGNKVSKWKWFCNILIVWGITGFWHGASWNFVFWGLYFAVILILEKSFLSRILEKLPLFFRWIYTFLLVMFGWVIFRINSMSEILFFFKRLLIYNKGITTVQFLMENFQLLYTIIFIVIAIIGMFPFIKKLMDKLDRTRFGFLNDFYIIIILFCSVIMLLSSSYNPFIYFRF